NPKIPGSGYPYGELCATGVAFKLAWALTQRSPISGEKAQSILLESLGVVALATIADVAPLTGENRVLVTFGLRALRASRSPGIRALMRSARIQGPIVARDVAFRLAPMLNAPGRLGDARSSLDLLLSESDDEATQLARELSRINRKRRVIQKTVLDSALERMKEELDRGRQAIVLAEEDWHPGVTGIVAGHIARETNLPTVLITLEGSRGRASARSVPGAHLPELFDACRDLLISYGGHARAAGLVIERENVEAFRDRFCEAVSQKCAGSADPPLDVDAEVELAEMKPASVREMERLAPFGEGNPPPLLIAHRCRVAGAVRKRRGGLSFFLRQGDVALSARVGKGVDLPDGPGGPERLTVAFRPSVAGSGEVDLEVLDFPDTRS
ncbi:MAG: DHHA1 domain-containing protein, partial [Planctomycetota bacterium]|nr:DHHA1 domain-containing protein [Planctomycetota bacterium]